MSDTDLLALCEQLDGLRAAAIPGPWRLCDDGVVETAGLGSDDFAITELGCSHDDAALIVAAVNALPALTAAVRGLLADRDTLARVATLIAHTDSGVVSVEALRQALSNG